MKTLKIFMALAAAAVLSFSACQKEPVEDPGKKENVDPVVPTVVTAEDIAAKVVSTAEGTLSELNPDQFTPATKAIATVYATIDTIDEYLDEKEDEDYEAYNKRNDEFMAELKEAMSKYVNMWQEEISKRSERTDYDTESYAYALEVESKTLIDIALIKGHLTVSPEAIKVEDADDLVIYVKNGSDVVEVNADCSADGTNWTISERIHQGADYVDGQYIWKYSHTSSGIRIPEKLNITVKYNGEQVASLKIDDKVTSINSIIEAELTLNVSLNLCGIQLDVAAEKSKGAEVHANLSNNGKNLLGVDASIEEIIADRETGDIGVSGKATAAINIHDEIQVKAEAPSFNSLRAAYNMLNIDPVTGMAAMRAALSADLFFDGSKDKVASFIVAPMMIGGESAIAPGLVLNDGSAVALTEILSAEDIEKISSAAIAKVNAIVEILYANCPELMEIIGN